MIEAAIEHAKEAEVAIAVAVVDESGILKAFGRMDNAPLMAVDASRKKAVTAAGMGIPTGQAWFDLVKDDPPTREGIHNIHDFLMVTGGYPIRIDDHVIGALGICGGTLEQDERFAKAAMSLVE